MPFERRRESVMEDVEDHGQPEPLCDREHRVQRPALVMLEREPTGNARRQPLEPVRQSGQASPLASQRRIRRGGQSCGSDRG